MAKTIQYLDLEGLKALYGVVDNKITVAVNGAKTELEGKITAEETRATGVENGINDKIGTGFDATNTVAKAIKANADAITAMDLIDAAVDGEFVTTVSQTDGKVTIARGKVAADKVTATAVAAGTDTVAIEGTDVNAQIKSLGKTIKTVEGNAAKYKVVKLTTDEVTALGDANVKEAYKVVSYTGAETADTNYTKVGETIKIYKDGNLVGAELGTGEDAQKLILTYSKADGTNATVKVDFAAIAFNAEFKNGLQVAGNGEISVKVDGESEAFLTVGADGVKLAGVQDAINTAKAAATTKVVQAEGATHVTVTADATAADGSVTYTIGETDIASKSALDAEITRAKAAEDKIEASVGLAADGSFTAPTGKNYINGATSVVNAIEKLDAQAKINENNINGMSVDEDNQTVTINEKSLTFAALTSSEILNAWKDKVLPSV